MPPEETPNEMEQLSQMPIEGVDTPAEAPEAPAAEPDAPGPEPVAETAEPPETPEPEAPAAPTVNGLEAAKQFIAALQAGDADARYALHWMAQQAGYRTAEQEPPAKPAEPPEADVLAQYGVDPDDPNAKSFLAMHKQVEALKGELGRITGHIQEQTQRSESERMTAAKNELVKTFTDEGMDPQASDLLAIAVLLGERAKGVPRELLVGQVKKGLETVVQRRLDALKAEARGASRRKSEVGAGTPTGPRVLDLPLPGEPGAGREWTDAEVEEYLAAVHGRRAPTAKQA